MKFNRPCLIRKKKIVILLINIFILTFAKFLYTKKKSKWLPVSAKPRFKGVKPVENEINHTWNVMQKRK